MGVPIVRANRLNCNQEQNEFELQSRYKVQFRSNILGHGFFLFNGISTFMGNLMPKPYF